uniref:Ovule protein n=1 Tax=Strongyloides papillosus TaxID=174720 RepID=A0A0N5B1Q1_STREA
MWQICTKMAQICQKDVAKMTKMAQIGQKDVAKVTKISQTGQKDGAKCHKIFDKMRITSSIHGPFVKTRTVLSNIKMRTMLIQRK